MSIFNFDSNPPSFSRDWKLFKEFYGEIGAFMYIAKEKAAYLDPTACSILSCSKEKINEFEFFNLLEKISKNPVEGEKHVYHFTNNNSSILIKMNIFESSDEWLGFVQKCTRNSRNPVSNDNISEYNPVTRLLSFPSFSQKVKRLMALGNQCYMASIYIDGLEKLSTLIAVESANNCITSVSEVIKSFSANNIIIASKSNYEVCVFFSSCDKAFVYNILNSMDEAVRKCVMTDDFGEIIDISDKCSVSLYIGCAGFPDEANEFNLLVNYSEFALYEAKNQKRHVINWFSEHSYYREKDSYKNNQIFTRIMRENLLTYYMHPIVDSRTGDIVAYEALTKSSGDTKMSSSQIMKIAKERNELHTLEKLTLFNTLKIISENQKLLGDRKLFISCLPGSMLSDDDFNELYITYGELLENTVMQISEHSSANSETIEKLKSRCGFVHANIAVDDYGTGYSNTSNMLKYSPDYIKIDRSLISDIHNDLKKQQLVTSVIEFCRENQITSIAEGIESSQELKTVIRLGVDLIQGNYASKPKPLILEKISDDVRDEIIRTNLEARPNGAKKIYTAKNDKEIDLLKLALEKYTDIHIRQSKLTITGAFDKPVKMNISVMDNNSCELTLRDVNIISGNSKPVISIGEYARLVLNVRKNNKLSYSGIFVPMGSQLEINGPGNLTVDCYSNDGIAIGNDCEHGYGDITVNMNGTLEIISNCEETVCIGGGYNDDDSEINLVSGKLKVSMYAQQGLGIGSFNGNSIISISDSVRTEILAAGTKIVGIGSWCGSAEIKSSADIALVCSGSQSVGIGVLNKGTGNINIEKGRLAFKMRSAKNSCIGAVAGNISTKISDAEIDIDSQGDESAGIGDVFGTGSVSVTKSKVCLNIHASNPMDIGTKNGDLSLNDCTIKSIVNEKTVKR